MSHRLSAGHTCGRPPVASSCRSSVAQVHHIAIWDGGGWRAPLAAVAAVSGPPVASIGQKRAEV